MGESVRENLIGNSSFYMNRAHICIYMILCIFDILYYREAQKYEIIYLETLQGSFRMSLFMDE